MRTNECDNEWTPDWASPLGTAPLLSPHPEPCPLLSGRPFDPQAPIVRSVSRVTGALVFGRRFLSEDPSFQELIQAIDFGMAFVSTVRRRVS